MKPVRALQRENLMLNKITYCIALAASIVLFHGSHLDAHSRIVPPGRVTVDHGDNPNVGGLDGKMKKGSGSSNPGSNVSGAGSPPGGSMGHQ